MLRQIVFFLATGLVLQAFAAPPELEFSYANDTAAERDTARVLNEMLAEYDVSAWIYTKRVHIEERATPHSHPVLTLPGRMNSKRQHLLSTFLHEQFHWHDIEDAPAGQKAMAAFTKMFPDPPSSREGGARDDFSTYLHLIVCDMEFQAMQKLVGDERAREIMADWNHYKWIYDKVLHDPRVREINRAHGFVVE